MQGDEWGEDKILTNMEWVRASKEAPVMPALDLCADCGHAADGHDRRGDNLACDGCKEAAQLGQHAPCWNPMDEWRSCERKPAPPCLYCGGERGASLVAGTRTCWECREDGGPNAGYPDGR